MTRAAWLLLMTVALPCAAQSRVGAVEPFPGGLEVAPGGGAFDDREDFAAPAVTGVEADTPAPFTTRLAGPPQFREGLFIIDRQARLVPPTGDDTQALTATLEFLPMEGLPPLPNMVLQPSQRLEAMLTAAADESSPIIFTLTGQVHVYDGRNHLLPTELSGFADDSAPVAVDDAAADAVDAPGAAEPAPAGPLSVEDLLAAGDDVGAAPAEGQSPAELMEAMAAERGRPSTPVLSLSADAPAAAPRVRDSAGLGGTDTRQRRRREGELVIEREVRVSRTAQEGQTMLVFEADGVGLKEPPVRLMPCRLRTWLETLTREVGDAQVFVVSGRIYRFNDQDYLLPTAARLRPDTSTLGY